MVNKIKYNSQVNDQDVLALKRMRTPSTDRLQSSIIDLTKELPQYTDQDSSSKVYNLSAFLDKVGLSEFSFWNSFKPYAATLAAGFAVIALSSSLWMPTQNDPVAADAFADLSTEQLADEIVWQDLMLLQDELAFAGL